MMSRQKASDMECGNLLPPSPSRGSQKKKVPTNRRTPKAGIRLLSFSLIFITPALSQTEAPAPKQIQNAIEAGLEWLHKEQTKEGADAGSFGNPRYRTATASFAGLAFLANGHTPGEGDYGIATDMAMQFVKSTMTPDGYLGTQDNSMYVHAICTLFGLSYLGRSSDPEKEKELAEWCRKAIKLILEAQKIRKARAETGGWRYSPYARESDLSVTSWQLLSLHAAKQCGYNIDDDVFDSALKFINNSFMETDEGEGGFLYRLGTSKEPEPAATGVAVFMKGLFDKELDDKVKRSLKYLTRYPPSWGGRQYNGFFFFGSFYMSQGMFQVGGETWNSYRPKMQRVLVDNQEGDGRWGFPPDNKPQSYPAGEAYCTAMAVLILSLDKQYLPMYQRQRSLF